MNISPVENQSSQKYVKRFRTLHQISSITELPYTDLVASEKHNWLWNTCTVTKSIILEFIGLVESVMQHCFLDFRRSLLVRIVMKQGTASCSGILWLKKMGRRSGRE